MSKFDFLLSDELGDAEEFLQNQKRYAAMTWEELAELPESEIVHAVTSRIESKFAEDWHDMCTVINSLPTPCINVYCAAHIRSEILDGGFSQAFFNSSRDFIGLAAQGFRAIEYPKLADIIEQALKTHYDSGEKSSGRGIEDFLALAEKDDYRTLDKDFRRVFDESKFDRLARTYILRYEKYFKN